MNPVAKNQFGLNPRDLATIERIFKQYPEIIQVVIFGSRAKGNYKTGSDIDLAIINPQVSQETRLKLADDFEESDLPYFVDVLYLPDLKEAELIAHIERVGLVFYEREKNE